MREILFKAKSIQTGEWIEGIPIKTHLGLFISFEENPHYCSQYGYMEIDDILIVDEKTLCQFTGLCDKNGKKIWENDIVKTLSDIYAQVKFGLHHTTGFAFEGYNQGFYVDFPDETCLRHELGYWDNKVEVKGNIFDNPELLQENTNTARCTAGTSVLMRL